PGAAVAGKPPYPGALPEEPIKPGAKAEALQTIANWMRWENKTPEDLQAFLNRGAESRKLMSSGEAQDVQMLVDASPGLQDLLGALVRSNKAVSERAQNVFNARQTGFTPDAGLPREANLPTRPMLGRPMSAKEAE